jgi:HK97 gp10 family phage protein
MPRGDIEFKLNLDIAGAKEKVMQAAFQAVQQEFELGIKPAAVSDSPVKTGTNRRSIDTETERTGTGIKGQIFTQSGYGGYLETGTSKMDARPYLAPAFNEGVVTIGDKIKEIIDAGE